MSTRMRPALTPEQWRKRSTGVVSISVVDERVHLVVRGPHDEVASLGDADQLWRLMALANDALPDGDARKVTAADVAVLRRLAASINEGTVAEEQLVMCAETLCEKIAALLPPHEAR